MFKKIILSCLIIVQTEASQVVWLGGGGDPPTLPTTIFDTTLKNLAGAKERAGLKIDMAFDGGHGETQKIIANEVKVSNKDFNAKNYEDMISKYLAKIKSGEIKKGEQLIVVMDTHGGDNTPKRSGAEPHKTHSLALTGGGISDYTKISGDKSSSMDVMLELSKAAKDYGVKLGIIDLSCHSGHSINLANENTCVITSTGPNHFAYTSFANEFAKQIDKGKSLEEVFLDTRKNTSDASYPMISNKAGRILNDRYYSAFSDYLQYKHDDNADKLTPLVFDLAMDNNLCKREDSFSMLIKEIERFEKISGPLKSIYSGEERLLEELKSYKKIQDELVLKIKKMGFDKTSKKEKITFSIKLKNGKIKTESEDISWDSIISMYPTNSIPYFEDLAKKAETRKEREGHLLTAEKFKQIDKKRSEIYRDYPGLKNKSEILSDISKMQADLIKKAGLVSQLSRKFYDFKYLEEKRRTKDNFDPCSSIKF